MGEAAQLVLEPKSENKLETEKDSSLPLMNSLLKHSVFTDTPSQVKRIDGDSFVLKNC